MIGKKLAHYEILEQIGSGGMGEVYRARDERLSREVAVKVLPSSLLGDPDRLRRFEQEARATGQLNHPNILAVYDTGEHEGVPFVVTELLEGETLRERTSGSPMPVRKTLDLAAQTASGLAAAHRKGIVHRDLKPDNLFITGDGRVKILDFGLAKLLLPVSDGTAAGDAPTQAQTDVGAVMGTVGYMSPEQVRGQEVDYRADIFSFGTILHEMLTGGPAFRAGSSVETLNAILQSEPPEASRTNPDVPPGLDRIIQRCMEKNPDERFQSASDLGFQLEALTSPSGPITKPQLTEVPRRRSAARPLLVATVGIAAVAAAFFVGKQTRAPESAPTYTQLTFRQGTIYSARFAPEGQSIIYSAAWEGAPTKLFTTQPGSPGSRSLDLTRAEVVSVSRTGELAVLLEPAFTVGWMRSGTLARVPQVGGVPREILENVQDADWNPDGETLAVVRDLEGKYRLEYPSGNVLFETEGWLSWPRFSRDGRWIAFHHHERRGDNRGRVAVVDLDGNAKHLSEVFSSMAGLAWSASGREILFTAGRVGMVRALYAVDSAANQRLVDGAPADMVLQDVSAVGDVLLIRNTARRGMIGLAPGETDERDLSYLDWSRPGALSADGTWLLFEEQGQGGGPDYSVYLRRTDGSAPVQLGHGLSCALSPDGRWAMTVTLDTPRKLVAVPRGPGEAEPFDVHGLKVNYGMWLPDGRRLLVRASKENQALRLYEIDPRQGSPRPLSPEGTKFPFAVSPDGSYVVAVGPDDVPRIYPVADGDPRSIPGVRAGDVPLRVDELGKSLLLFRRGEIPTRIERLDLESGARSPWLELAPSDRAGLLDVGFILLSADGNSYVYSYRRMLSTLYFVDGLQ
jgi:serine/threonine protein kinase/Tol biopolymer transport system component